MIAGLYGKIVFPATTLLTDSVPRLKWCAHEGAHYNIYDKPASEDDDEPDEDIGEYFFGFRDAAGVAYIGEIQKTGPGEKYSRQHDRKIDGRVQNVLCKLRKVAHGARLFTRISARHDGGDIRS